MIRSRYSSFQAWMRATSASRPRSWRVLPSSSKRRFSMTAWVPIPAWSVPGHPERVVPHHPVPADEQVLHDVVHGVAHVQGAGDVGQRHHDDVAVRAVVRDGGEGVGGEPPLIDVRFVLLRFVELRDLVGHRQKSSLKSSIMYHIGESQANKMTGRIRDWPEFMIERRRFVARPIFSDERTVRFGSIRRRSPFPSPGCVLPSTPRRFPFRSPGI